jgi:hypothetical protein
LEAFLPAKVRKIVTFNPIFARKIPIPAHAESRAVGPLSSLVPQVATDAKSASKIR